MSATVPLVVLAAVAAAVLALAGPAAAGSDTDLRIRVWNEGRDATPTRTFTLRCDPAGGSLRNPGLACRKLAVLRSPFAPLRKDLQCTQLYGGPQEALVTGSYRGQRVWVLLNLRDGCRIDRWRKLAFLTPGFGTAANS